MGNCQAREYAEEAEENNEMNINQAFMKNFLVPQNEKQEEVNLQTGSKLNIEHERDDFAYIGTLDLQGYSQFTQTYQQLEQNNSQFQDPDFTSDMNSLIEKYGSRYTQHWKKYTWKRPTEFFDGEYFLFKKSLKTFQLVDPLDFKQNRIGKQNPNEIAEGIEPDDIKQGELGDCYFLATISAIAEFPWRIKELFVSKRINNYGIYCVKMCHFGEWQTIVVDDYFPCNYYGPAFTRGNDNEIWVLILEKAWAKLFGSYERIEAGLAREALKSLTAAPTSVVWTDCPEDELWDTVKVYFLIFKKIQNGDQENFIMTCGSQGEDKLQNSEAEKVGLVPGHAYTLIGCALHEGNKLVLLRNPWGTKEWKGKWSDNEKIWTPQLQKELNHHLDANDGTFYMELNDFRKYFTDMQICYYKDGYQYTSYKVESDAKHAKIIKMKVLQSSDYYISVNQESKRVYANDSNYQYSNCKLLVAKMNQNKTFTWMGAKQYSDREFWIKVYLTPGDYLVYVKSYWFDKQYRQFVLSSYGKGKVQFEQIGKAILGNNYLEQIMKSHPMNKIQPYQKISGIQKNFEVYVKEGFGIFWIKNNTKKQFTSKITLTKMNGLKLRKPFRGNTLELMAPSQQEAIAIVNVDSKGYSLQFQESYQY